MRYLCIKSLLNFWLTISSHFIRELDIYSYTSSRMHRIFCMKCFKNVYIFYEQNWAYVPETFTKYCVDERIVGQRRVAKKFSLNYVIICPQASFSFVINSHI